MAVATKYVKAQGYSSTTAYNFKIEATETDNVEGSTRQVNVKFSVYAQSPGGYKNYSDPKGYIRIDNVQETSTTVKSIWPRGEWITISTWSGYLEAGQTHTITGRYNVGNNTVDYLPAKGNQDVSVSLEVSATGAILTRVDLDTNFIYNGKITPYFTDPTGTTRYYGLALLGLAKPIVSGNSPLIVSQSGVELTISQSDMIKLYEYLDSNDNTINANWVLYTYSDNTYSTPIGNTVVNVPDMCSIPSYTLTWDEHSIEDSNALVEYGGHPLSYYIPTGSLAKYLSKAKLIFEAVSSVGSTFGKIITYKVNDVSTNSPYVAPSNYNGESYIIKANDNRVSEISYSYSPTVINYFYPYVSNVVVIRPTPTSNKVKVSYDVNYYNGNGMQNLSNATYDFYYRESTSDPWVKVNSLSGSGTSGTASFTEVEISNIDPNKNLYFKIEVSDRIGYNISPSSYIPKGLPLWNGYVDSNGNNIFNVNGKEIIQSDLEVNGEIKTLDSNNKYISIEGSNNYANYQTDQTNGHLFNTDVKVQGDVYGGSNYNKRLAYVDEIPTIPVKSIMTGKMSANYTLSTTNATKLTLVANSSIVYGTGLSISDGGIKIGAGITKVLVNAQINFAEGGTGSSRRGVQIFKNSHNIAYCNINNVRTYTGASISPILLEVEENDIIYLYGLNQGTTGSQIQASNSWLTVQVID